MGRRSRLSPLADLVMGSQSEDEEELQNTPELALTDRRLEALEKWKDDPWAFLTGTDPDTGRPIIWTQDERDKKEPLKPFPNLPYLHYLVDLLENEEKLAIEKSSQMIVSTTVLLHSGHDCAFHPSSVMLSKHTEGEATELLFKKIRVPWSHMPPWLQRAIACTKRPAIKVSWKKTYEGKPLGSQIWGLTENAAWAAARGNTYTRGLIDEAEYQEMLPQLITAMKPRTDQLVIWSTPNNAGQGAMTFKGYVGVAGR